MNVFDMFKNWKKSSKKSSISFVMPNVKINGEFVVADSDNPTPVPITNPVSPVLGVECEICCVLLDGDEDTLEAMELGICQDCYDFDSEVDDDIDEDDEGCGDLDCEDCYGVEDDTEEDEDNCGNLDCELCFPSDDEDGDSCCPCCGCCCDGEDNAGYAS
jgi:hypothetical protein